MHKVALQKPPFALKLANFFGAFGYIAILLEWMWLGLIALYPLLQAGRFDFLLPNTAPIPHTPVATPTEQSAAMIIIGIVVTVVCIAITIYALITMPRTIGKTGKAVTTGAVAAIIPRLTHHKKISTKSRRRLTFRLTVMLKSIALIVPLIIVAILPPSSILAKEIAVYACGILAAWGLFNFGVQIALALGCKLDTGKLW